MLHKNNFRIQTKVAMFVLPAECRLRFGSQRPQQGFLSGAMQPKWGNTLAATNPKLVDNVTLRVSDFHYVPSGAKGNNAMVCGVVLCRLQTWVETKCLSFLLGMERVERILQNHWLLFLDLESTKGFSQENVCSMCSWGTSCKRGWNESDSRNIVNSCKIQQRKD